MSTSLLTFRGHSRLGPYIKTSSEIYFHATTQTPRNHKPKMIPIDLDGKGPQTEAPKSRPIFTEMAAQRIAVLENAVSTLNSRTEGTPKKLLGFAKRRDKHLAEIAELKAKLARSSQDELSGDKIGGIIATIPTDASRHTASPKTPSSSTSPAGNWRTISTPVQPPRYKLRSRTIPASQEFVPELAPSRQQTPEPQIPRNSDRRSAPWRTTVRDAIVPPSEASGGVPEALQSYIERASLPPQIALQPQHILLVIDLNGTMLYRPDRKRPSHFVARQSTQLFLDYVFSKFQVMIWSSARPENVRLMCHQLFPDASRQRLIGEWGRDRMGLSPEDYNRRVQVYKRFEKVWADPSIQRRHPLSSSGALWDQSNTVLIDDSVEKARSQPFNLVEVPEFTGHAESDVLKRLAEYLDNLLMQTDVSAYIRQNPFKSETTA